MYFKTRHLHFFLSHLQKLTMARILITGSAEGLGSLAAKELASRGHEVHLHARSASRAEDARKNCPKAANCFIADLSNMTEVKKLAEDVKAAGPFDSIVHSAGVMRGLSGKTAPNAKYGMLFATNTLAPYVLTSLIAGHSKRYVFLSSQMHAGGDGTLRNIRDCGYGDSKLHNVMLAFGFARHLKDQGVEESNVLDPGWVPTKMVSLDELRVCIRTCSQLTHGSGWPGSAAGH